MQDQARKLEILGPGCARCKETLRVVQDVVAHTGASFEMTGTSPGSSRRPASSWTGPW